jgi:hypothetical protein
VEYESSWVRWTSIDALTKVLTATTTGAVDPRRDRERGAAVGLGGTHVLHRHRTRHALARQTIRAASAY